MKRHMLTISLVILGLCVLGVSASAQDVFKVNYFANNVTGAPESAHRFGFQLRNSDSAADAPQAGSSAAFCACCRWRGGGRFCRCRRGRRLR